MEQVNSLWNLENHHNSLRTYKKELNSLENESMIENAGKKLIEMENNLERLKSNQVSVVNKLREAEGRLKEYNYRIEEVDKSLYDGQTKDIRQLEYLSHEKEKLKGTIDDIEIKIIELMEETEEVGKELISMEESIKEIREENINLKKQYQKIGNDLMTKIQLEEDKIRILEETIDEILLNRYTQIRKTKGSGVAKVNNQTCSGCNMFIPTILIDRLNNSNEIIYCESCGRILCKP